MQNDTPPIVPPIIPSDEGINPAVLDQNTGMSKKALIVILVTAFALAGIAYAGIWYWQKQSVNALNSVPTFTPRPDPISGWKTYTNTQYGFEFKYPSTYSLTETGFNEYGLQVELDRDVITKYLKNAGNQLETGSEIIFEIDPDWIASNSKDSYISRFYGLPYSTKQVSIDNHIVTEFSGSSPWAKYLVNRFIDPNTRYFGYNLYIGPSTLDEKMNEYIKDYEAIWKTFKFTDSNSGQTACTQEAKLCPDGSAVGRTGPNCEFAACPK